MNGSSIDASSHQRRISQVCDQVDGLLRVTFTVYDECIDKQVSDYMIRLLELERAAPVLTQGTADRLSKCLQELRQLKVQFTALKTTQKTTGSTVKVPRIPEHPFEHLLSINYGHFDGDIMNWEAYRVKVTDYILMNSKLSHKQVFRLLSISLSETVTESEAFKKYFNGTVECDMQSLLEFLNLEYGSGEAAYEKMMATVVKCPNLGKQSGDTPSRRKQLLTVANEVLRRANCGYYCWEQKEDLLMALCDKLPQLEDDQCRSRYHVEERILEPPCSNPLLENLVRTIQRGLATV